MPILAAAFALATIALGVTLWSPWRVAPEPPRPVRFQIAPPEKLTLGIGFALSPDGTKLAFQASGTDGVLRLWVRSMDALEARPLPGTEGNLPAPIFWSFDSRFVTYDGGGKLKKVDVAGGPPQTLCDASNVVVGGSWNRDGVVLFGVNSGLIQRVSSAGGTPTPVTGLNPSLKATTTLFPVFLPDQRHFLYWAGGGGPGEQGIYVGSIDSKPEQQSSKRLLATEFGAVLAPSTESNRVEVLFLRDGTVMAQALDLTHMEMTGEATPVAEQVGSYLALGFVSASATGALAYRSGGGGSGTVLGLLDRQGKSLGTAGDPRAYLRLALPPTKTALP